MSKNQAPPGNIPANDIKPICAPDFRRPGLLAPSLASATVLLTVIGLSHEWMMNPPSMPRINASQPRLTAEPVSARETSSMVGRIDDSSLHAQKLDGNKESLLSMNDRPQEAVEGRDDDGAFFSADQALQDGKEVDELRQGGSRDPRSRVEPKAKTENELMVNKTSPAVLPAPAASPVEEKKRNRREAERYRIASLLQETFEEIPGDSPQKSQEKILGQAWVSEQSGSSFARSEDDFNFLDSYQNNEPLHFQPATGYWANSYIPGDPEIRLLSARLAGWDRSWLPGNVALERDVAPFEQPFDAPADNALALSLMADAGSVAVDEQSEDGTRMRLQVGIQGIEHRRGLRPAMNVGVVVDLPPDAPDELRIATRSLLDAILQSKQAGDRFSLLLTGSGLLVEADDFRFGSLQLAKQQILGQQAATDAAVSLHEALAQTGAMLAQSDDPSRPLGSSSVLLISADTLGDIDRLTALAHEQAKAGITLSVFPLGSKVKNDDVEQLVLAGLGNRRFLEAPAQARQLIEEELHASSRAVARAARLSIRLAPGVRLIDVIGSERLDIRRTQRVREIEHSMDQRLSANFGIQADRGQDEDGIQIVIPSIYSGDSLTVLLDVVVTRPGAIADVSLRYKDLVFLRNSSLQGQLDLPGGESARGPAQLAVLKNLLSRHFVRAVEQASEALGQLNSARAAAILGAMRSSIDQARRDLPAWANDPDLIRDQQVLDRYLAALASPGAGSHQPYLSDSLRYAAWAKTHRPLEEWNK